MRIATVIGIGVFLAVQTFAQKVSIDFDEGIDFSAYRTYEWKGCYVSESDPVVATSRSLLEQRVRNAVNEQLTAKGIAEASENPDFLVSCMGQRHATRRIESDYAGSWGPRWRYGWGSGWGGIRTVEWNEGLLIIDIVDAKKEQLSWWAYCTATIDDPSKVAKKVRNAVKKAFKKYPPRS